MRRCETCELLTLGQNIATATCGAPRPANVDFRWDKAEIPLGRFVSEIDYLRECPLYAGPVAPTELDRRAAIAADYASKLQTDGRWTNRFAAAKTSNDPSNTR